ncbi:MULTISPECIES: Abi family protein [Bifidobacterium]|uniref:Abi family protein n=1 Tax=Bifidobacterium TaxID=1678 RepID=UPI001BDCFE3A|nr:MULTISPECIES: Abi family protein [Bifidobacterium]MBT1160678.1 Abi family protein [Bifidobacterium sp. SO1]MBW3079484.1 Abi family protein [Bifidobacterium simiiventris]
MFDEKQAASEEAADVERSSLTPKLPFQDSTDHSPEEMPTAELLLSRPRLQPYLDAAEGKLDDAVSLYRWNQEFISVVLKHSSDVEMAVRNAMDRQLRHLSRNRYNMPDWIGIEDNSTPDEIYSVLGKGIRDARVHAKTEAHQRPKDHPRFGVRPTRDDVLAQLTFGTWDILLGSNISVRETTSVPQLLWAEGLCEAFPGMSADDLARRHLSLKLKRIRTLRNRAAHGENLLRVEPERRLTDMLSILSVINPGFPQWSMQHSRYRAVAKKRPRFPLQGKV